MQAKLYFGIEIHMKMWYFVLIAIVQVVWGQNVEMSPGVRVRITQAGLDYARDVALDTLMRELNDLDIPVMEERISSATMTVSNVRVESFPRPDSVLRTIPHNGLRWSATNLHPTIKADYNARAKIIRWTVNKSGRVTIRGRSMQFFINFMIGRDEEGRPSLTVDKCHASGSVRLSFDGGFDTMLNMGSRLFRSKIRTILLKKICEKAEAEINEKTAEILSNFPVRRPLRHGMELDYHLIQPPYYGHYLMETFHKGSMYLATEPGVPYEEPPFHPPSIPVHPEHQDKMLYLYITNYLINSGFYAAANDGRLSLSFSNDNLPENIRPYLRTSCDGSICFGTLFPQVRALYPDSMIAVSTLPTQPPQLTIDEGHLVLTIWSEGHLTAEANGVHHALFSVNATISTRLYVVLSDTKIRFNVTNISPQIDILSSAIGDVGLNILFQSVARTAVQNVVQPILSELGDNGFDLPKLENLHFVDPQIITEASTGNVLVLGTNVLVVEPEEADEEPTETIAI